MNSPSRISRSSASSAGGVSLANTRVADTYFTMATGDPQSLDSSHRQASDQRALRDPADDDDRHRGDRYCRGQVSEEQALGADAAYHVHLSALGVRARQVD